MENYIITNETVALKKHGKRTIIYNVDKVRVINKTIGAVLETNCNFYGSNLNGRKKSAQKILNIKYRVPIVICEKNELILIPTENLRNNHCLLIMLNKVVDYEETDDKLKIRCINEQEFIVNLSKYSFEKLIINSLKLNNLLNWRKSVNIV